MPSSCLLILIVCMHVCYITSSESVEPISPGSDTTPTKITNSSQHQFHSTTSKTTLSNQQPPTESTLTTMSKQQLPTPIALTTTTASIITSIPTTTPAAILLDSQGAEIGNITNSSQHQSQITISTTTPSNQQQPTPFELTTTIVSINTSIPITTPAAILPDSPEATNTPGNLSNSSQHQSHHTISSTTPSNQLLRTTTVSTTTSTTTPAAILPVAPEKEITHASIWLYILIMFAIIAVAGGVVLIYKRKQYRYRTGGRNDVKYYPYLIEEEEMDFL